mmetsp:Transcript_62932/g.184061  ORF Transcript_62932/g.184061 Transcript_62932/m.184061 type:complete len:346 (+) Transcript_62932:526-1563(+)
MLPRTRMLRTQQPPVASGQQASPRRWLPLQTQPRPPQQRGQPAELARQERLSWSPRPVQPSTPRAPLLGPCMLSTRLPLQRLCHQRLAKWRRPLARLGRGSRSQFGIPSYTSMRRKAVSRRRCSTSAPAAGRRPVRRECLCWAMSVKTAMRLRMARPAQKTTNPARSLSCRGRQRPPCQDSDRAPPRRRAWERPQTYSCPCLWPCSRPSARASIRSRPSWHSSRLRRPRRSPRQHRRPLHRRRLRSPEPATLQPAARPRVRWESAPRWCSRTCPSTTGGPCWRGCWTQRASLASTISFTCPWTSRPELALAMLSSTWHDRPSCRGSGTCLTATRSGCSPAPRCAA